MINLYFIYEIVKKLAMFQLKITIIIYKLHTKFIF